MNNMIKVYRPDYCVECRTPRSIEIYNFFNSPIGYSKVLDDMERGLEIAFDKVPLYYARCRSCKRKFIIFWKDAMPGVPIPVPYNADHSSIEVFLSNYAKRKDPDYTPKEK